MAMIVTDDMPFKKAKLIEVFRNSNYKAEMAISSIRGSLVKAQVSKNMTLSDSGTRGSRMMTMPKMIVWI